MTEKFNAEWTITPDKTPSVIRRCKNCNRKMPFYCSEKFRVNGNHAKLDIWLIYKCEKCDATWKLTIKKGIRPQDIPADIFDGFVNNDKALAWRYAFDRALLKSGECEVSCDQIGYGVEETGAAAEHILNGDDWKKFLPAADGGEAEKIRIRVKCHYPFDLKLSALISSRLGVSVSEVKKLAERGLIKTEPDCQIMKYKIRHEIILIFTSS